MVRRWRLRRCHCHCRQWWKTGAGDVPARSRWLADARRARWELAMAMVVAARLEGRRREDVRLLLPSRRLRRCRLWRPCLAPRLRRCRRWWKWWKWKAGGGGMPARSRWLADARRARWESAMVVEVSGPQSRRRENARLLLPSRRPRHCRPRRPCLGPRRRTRLRHCCRLQRRRKLDCGPPRWRTAMMLLYNRCGRGLHLFCCVRAAALQTCSARTRPMAHRRAKTCRRLMPLNHCRCRARHHRLRRP
ncbi:hypothetical protein HDK64DRAFT_280600 [Phyllosticta capitalensis]